MKDALLIWAAIASPAGVGVLVLAAGAPEVGSAIIGFWFVLLMIAWVGMMVFGSGLLIFRTSKKAAEKVAQFSASPVPASDLVENSSTSSLESSSQAPELPAAVRGITTAIAWWMVFTVPYFIISYQIFDSASTSYNEWRALRIASGPTVYSLGTPHYHRAYHYTDRTGAISLFEANERRLDACNVCKPPTTPANSDWKSRKRPYFSSYVMTYLMLTCVYAIVQIGVRGALPDRQTAQKNVAQ